MENHGNIAGKHHFYTTLCNNPRKLCQNQGTNAERQYMPVYVLTVHVIFPTNHMKWE